MNDPSAKITDRDLQSYVDGELDAARREEIEAYLAENPAAAKTVAAYRELNAGLQGLFAEVLEEPVPERLQLPAAPEKRPRLLRLAAAVAWLSLGVVIGWVVRPQLPKENLVAELAKPALFSYAAYAPEVLHPVEVKADQEQHLAKWLTKRLGARVRIPDLTDRGFRLVGGRLLPGKERPGALFMYEDANGRRVTLNLTRPTAADTPTAFRYTEKDGVGVFYWLENGFGYALTGTVGKEDLLALAREVYQQFTT